MATRPDTAPDVLCPPEVRRIETRLVARDWRELDNQAGQAKWDALAEWAAEPNPFFESWYLLPALREFDCQAHVQLMCLEVDGQLGGVMPMRQRLHYYGYPFPQWSTWLHANCFLGVPLVAKGLETVFWRELLGWLDRHSELALFAHLSHLPLQGPLWEALAEVCAQAGRGAAVVKREERAMLCSDLSPGDYFEAALGGKKRKELRRQRRRLEEEGRFEVRRRTDDGDLDGWIEEFLALEGGGWKGEEGSSLASSPHTEALFREALRGAAVRGRLERLGLRIDGRPVAMLANFLTPPGAFSFKTAFDERFARYSPGVLLQRENLQMLARGDIAWADSCAAADHPMIDHLWRERRAIGRVNLAIGGGARRALFGAIARRETGCPAGELT